MLLSRYAALRLNDAKKSNNTTANSSSGVLIRFKTISPRSSLFLNRNQLIPKRATANTTPTTIATQPTGETGPAPMPSFVRIPHNWRASSTPIPNLSANFRILSTSPTSHFIRCAEKSALVYSKFVYEFLRMFKYFLNVFEVSHVCSHCSIFLMLFLYAANGARLLQGEKAPPPRGLCWFQHQALGTEYKELHERLFRSPFRAQ